MTADQSADSAERGYVIVDPGLTDAELDVVDRACVGGYGKTGRYPDAWRRHEAVRSLASNPVILGTLRRLFGREPFPFQTLNFNRGTEQPEHSDTIHFDSTPAGYMAAVWVALEDIDANNGAVRVYPGTHRLPHLRVTDPSRTDAYTAEYEPMVQRLIAERNLAGTEVYLRRGQALVWAANTLHGGTPVREAARTRRSQVTHYYFEGCEYFTPLTGARRYPTDVRTGRIAAGVAAPVQARAKAWVRRHLRA